MALVIETATAPLRDVSVGVLDEAESAALREQIRADRPAQLPTFDMGPPIEEILARPLEEIGLPAPSAPRAL